MTKNYDSFNVLENTYDGEVVESGLSSGELRQSMLDRLKNAIKQGTFIDKGLSYCRVSEDNKNVFLFKHNYKISREDLISKFDKTLYEHLSDEDIADKTWEFPDETIFVQGVIE